MKSIKQISYVVLAIALAILLWDFLAGGDGPVPSFANSYSVSKAECMEKNIPITSFTIEYPGGLEPMYPDNNRDFLTLQLRAADLVLEELWIRSESFTYEQEDRIEEWLQSYIERYNLNFDEIQGEHIGLLSFGDQKYYQIRGTLNLSSTGEIKGQPITYSGQYKLISILPIPQIPGINGVAITMIAHPDSEIKDFDDFPTRGLIGKAFRTFRYTGAE
jgi:hypothetical protein